MKYKKAALITDIHFGRKNNSELHNQDCLNFLDWFISEVKKDSEIDHICFLGDWYEHRSAINGLTLKYSHEGAKKLNSLGIPVIFELGNHDLYYRNNRKVFTTTTFESMDNFKLITEPTVLDNIGNGVLFCPFLFPEEYPNLKNYQNIPVWLGHFEFKGFVVTGESKTLDHGPDHTEFSKPLRIFSGHFHKRQQKDNVIYIGNTFPADFSDANDNDRGMTVYDYTTDTVTFKNWPDCPKYIKTKLSELLEGPKKILKSDARVMCLVDVPISFEESNELKESLVKKFKLRELSLDEGNELSETLSETEVDIEGMELESTKNLIKEMLLQIKSDKIKPTKLVAIFENLK